MATAKDYTNAMLNALDVYVENATTSLKLDKTITVTITGCTNSDNRQYTCSYNGGTLTVYAYEGSAYSIGDDVFVLVPQNDFSKKKYITGIATTEASSSSTLSNKNLYNYVILNNDSVSAQESATLDCATEDYAYLYVKDKEAVAPYLINGEETTYQESGRCVDCVQVKQTALEKNLSNENVGQIALAVTVQTKNLQLQHKQGRYGIIINTVCTDTSQMDSAGIFVNKTVSYEINSNNMTGNPFAYNNPSTQYIIFDSLNDKYTFQYIKDIVFYCDGFSTGSISLNKIQFLCLNQDIQTSADSNFSLYITTNGKNCFTSFRSDDKITLTAIFKEQNANRSQEYKATYYWGIQDTTITSDNATYYNEKLGEGWRYVAGGRGDQDQYRYTTSGSQNTESSVVYKLVADYQASDDNTVTLSSQCTLYNLANSIQTKITSSSGKIFNFKGSTTLTCTINGKTKNYVDGESDSVFAFSWNRTAKKEAASTTGTTTQLAQNQKSNTLEVKDLTDLTEKYVEYTCCVTKNGFSVGTASIILRNSETWNTTGTRVEIINGSQLFQYDERGKSPTLAATPQVISTLYARFYDSQGNKVYDSSASDDAGFSVQWRLPANNSLIIPPSNATQDNDSDYMVLTGRSCNFTIADSYSASSINNQIQVAISDLSTDEIFSQETSFVFTKVGLNGTNGTANAVTIVPREDYDMSNNSQLALITIDETQSDGQVKKRHFWNAIKSYTYNENGELVSKTYAGEDSPILQSKVFINGSQYTDFSSSWYPAGNSNNNNSLHMTFSNSEEENCTNYGIVKYSEKDNEFEEEIKDRYKVDTRIACAEIGFNDSTVYDYYPIPTIEYQNGYTFKEYPITILQNKYLRNVYYSSNGSMAADPTYSQDQGAFYKIDTTKSGESVTAYTNWSVTGGLDDKTPELRLNTSKGAATGNKAISTYTTALVKQAVTLAETIQSFVKNYTGDARTKNYLTSLMNKANLIISQSGVNWNIKINNLKTECDSWTDTNSQDENVKLYADNVDVKILRNYYLKLYDSYNENSALTNASSEKTESILTQLSSFLTTSWPNFTWDYIVGAQDSVSKETRRTQIQNSLGGYIDDEGLYVSNLQNWGAYDKDNNYLLHSEFYDLFKSIFYKKEGYENQSITIVSGADNDAGYTTSTYNKNNISIRELNSCFLIWVRTIKRYIEQTINLNLYTYVDGKQVLISNSKDLGAYYNNLMDKWIAEIGGTRTVVTGTHTEESDDGTAVTVTDTAERYYYQYDDGTDLSIEKLNEKYQTKWNSVSAYLRVYGSRAARDTLTNCHIDLDSFLNAMQSVDAIDDFTDGIYVIPPEQCTAIMCNDNVIGEVHATISQDNKVVVDDVIIAKITFPVHLGLNTYELSSLNGWDGQSIELNDKENYIIAPQIGAGVKDTATNHFTGIVMGAVTNPTEDGLYDASQNVGLLGYAKGEQSIFLDAKTGSATFGLISEDEGEGCIQLVPGGISSIGGWRIGNKFLANINDGEYELRTDPDLRSVYYDDNDANTYQKVRIPTNKGGIVLSADKPYIHVKSNPYTVAELGDTPSVESDTINQLGIGDSLEVKVDPNNNSVFSIVQHTANHQVALQDNLYYGTLKKNFVKPFSVGVDGDYENTEILYTYQYDLMESGAIKSYNSQAGLITLSKTNPYSQIYGSCIARMHDDNIVNSISNLISSGSTTSSTDSSNLKYDLDGTNIAGGSFNPKTGALTIKLNETMKAQAKVNYASDQFISGVLDYNDSYYAKWITDGTSLVLGGQATVEPVNYVGPIKYTWTVYHPDESNADYLTITSYQNQLQIGSNKDYVGWYVQVKVTDEGLIDSDNPNGKTYTLDTKDIKSWNEDGTDYGSYDNTIQDNEELTDTIEYAAFGDDYSQALFGDDDYSYKKCCSAIQVIEKYEAVDTETEGYSVYGTYDLTQSNFTEPTLPFPEEAADGTKNWVVRWKSTVTYVNHVFMPDYKIGYLDLLSYVVDGLKIRATVCLSNSTFKDFKSAGIGLTMKIVEASDPSKVYYSEEVTDWTGNGDNTYTECLFTFNDEVEEGYYQVFLQLQDEQISEEEWEESIVYEIVKKVSSTGDPYFTLHIAVENESNLWNNEVWTSNIAQNYTYGQLYVGDVVASCLVGGATKTGLYYEKELNINDGTDTAKAAHALSMTTPNFIRVYSTYKDLLDTLGSDTYSVCVLTEEDDNVYYRSVKSLQKDAVNELFDAANEELNGTTDETDTGTTTTEQTVEYVDISPDDISKYYNWQEINRIGIDETGQLYSNGAQNLRVTTKYGIVPAFGTHDHYGFGLESQNYTDGYGRDQLLKVFADSYQEEAEQRETIISGGDELSRGIRVFSSGDNGGSSLWYSDTQNSKDNIASFVTVDANGVTISSNNNIAFNLNGASYNLSDIISGIYSGDNNNNSTSSGGATSNNYVIADKMTKLKTVSVGEGHGTAYNFIKMSSISDSSVAGRMKKLWQENGSTTNGGYCTYNGRYLIGLTPHCATGNGKTSGNISWFTNASVRNKYSPRYIDIVFKDGKKLECIWCKSITGTNKFGSNSGKQTVTFITSGDYKKPKDAKSSLHWIKGKKVNKVISYQLKTTTTSSASKSSASTAKKTANNANSSLTKGQLLLNVALKQLKLWKQKKVTKYKYTKYCGAMPNGSYDYAWCSAFVCYCLHEAGFGKPKKKSCDNLIKWTKDRGWYKTISPHAKKVPGIQPGDIIFYTPHNKSRVSTHVAICKTSKPNGWHNQVGANGTSKGQIICVQDRTHTRKIVGIARPGGFKKSSSAKSTIATASLEPMAVSLASDEELTTDSVLLADSIADETFSIATIADGDTTDDTETEDVEVDEDGEEGDVAPDESDDEEDDYVDSEENYSLGWDSDGQPYTVYGADLPTVLPSLTVTKNDITFSTQEQSLTNATSDETDTAIQIENDSAVSHGITFNTNYSGCLSLRNGIIKTSKAPLHTAGGLIVNSNFKVYTDAQFFTSITLDNNDSATQPILRVGSVYDVKDRTVPASIYVGNEDYLNGLIVSHGDIQANNSLSVGKRLNATGGGLHESGVTIEIDSDQYGTIKFHGKQIGTDETTKNPIYSDTYELTYDKMGKLNKLLSLSDEAVDKLLELLS